MNRRNPTPEIAGRIKTLMARMTLEEKIAQTDMIRGVDAIGKEHPAHFCTVADDAEVSEACCEKMFGAEGIGFIHDIYAVPRICNAIQKFALEKTRLGIPVIFTGEALHGICRPDATIFPTPLAMAATFNPSLVEKVGAAIAAESRAYSVTEILAPNLDIGREIRWGRLEETFGEDTYLASKMAYAIVHGEQGDDISKQGKVAAEPKHYCVHGIAEGGLNSGAARVGVREVETEYLPVFEAAIRDAGAYNAMASYNSIDGETVIASRHYLTDVLRKRWGMRGYVRADFGAINRLHVSHRIARGARDAIGMAYNAGLCVQGFDFPSAFWRSTLKSLVVEGVVDIATLDEAVRRILRVKFELGLFDHPYVDADADRKIVRCPGHVEVAMQAAKESICLVKNDGLLPLRGDYSRIAVVGPGSNEQYVGGYSAIPYTYRPATVCESLKRLLPEVEFVQADGCSYTAHDMKPIPPAWFRSGVKARFFKTSDFSGDCIAEEHYDNIQFSWIFARPNPSLPFSNYGVVFEADITVDMEGHESSDAFDGSIVFNTADTFRLHIDGRLVLENAGRKAGKSYSVPFRFVRGGVHRLKLEFVCDSGGGDVSLCVGYNGDKLAEALEVARPCDAVILVCGENQFTSGEGKDRCTITLEAQQQRLVDAIVQLGKPMALVVQSGRPVDLRGEMETMNAVVISLFGGDYGGEAAAQAIAGRFSPAGRLPVSFPLTIGHLPSYYCRLPGRSSMDYCEMSGNNLFDFGFGLSYTTFEYANLRIENLSHGRDILVKVKADVTNAGSHDSDEVVQLYVNDVFSSICTPPKRLQGFERIHLKKGETRTVDFALGFEAFRLFNLAGEWVVEPGDFEIMVGGGSNDIRLNGVLALCAESSFACDKPV